MTIIALIAISLLGAVIYLMNRIEHALIYNCHEIIDDLLRPNVLRKRFMAEKLAWWDSGTFLWMRGIHKSGNAMHAALGILMIFGALGWTGLDWQGIVSALLIGCTYYLFADPWGQVFINAGAGDDSDPASWWQIPVGFVVLLIAIALGAT